MRIAIFSEVYWPMVSGVSLVLQRLVGALEQRGHVVRVYAPTYELPRGSCDPCHVFRVPSRRLFIYPDVQWGAPQWPTIRADFAAFRPDLVHVATEFAMGTAGIRLAREFGVPVVASAHTDYESYSARYGLEWLMGAGWRYLRWFYGHASQVLCPSHQFEQHLQRRGVCHTGIWSRGVDLQMFSPAHRSEEVRQSLGIAPHHLMVLHVGRLAVEKNIELLMDAWQRIKGERGDARLVLVGTGPLESGLRATASANVVVTGVRSGRQLSELYASADVFAFPSSTETFGNVLLEAMASGVSSLAVRAGGVLDFAAHDINAWLVEPDNAEAFGQGLLQLIEEPLVRQRLIAGGLEAARLRDWGHTFDLLMLAYRRALMPRSIALAA